MELIIAVIVYSITFAFAIFYFISYQKRQLMLDDTNSFFNNPYIFETIPSAFPTLGILCTALGITLGIWNFDTANIEASMPQLLNGLKLAFFATMLGIVGLLVFQKWAGVILNNIEKNPLLPAKESNEVNALNVIIELLKENQSKNEESNKNLLNQIDNSFSSNLKSISADLFVEIKEFKTQLLEKIDSLNQSINTQEKSSKILLNGIDKSLIKLQTENKEFGIQSIKNSESIINAMSKNNKFIIEKFDTFSDLLAKNNTEALVDVMKNVTETFNKQMNELIERLVKENFEELNKSVQNMNTWQQQNKQQITELTNSYKDLTKSFKSNAKTLTDVTTNTKSLLSENSKLNKLVNLMNKILIEENNFTEITTKLSNTVEILQTNTEAFDNTTNKLNEWVRTERNFKDAAEVLIIKLEQFRDLNSDVWKQYRKEMESAVSIIKNTSSTISEDVENINEEFYERLNSTMQNLDMCIQRAISKYDKQ